MERERGKREKEKVQERLKENTVVASRRSRREKKARCILEEKKSTLCGMLMTSNDRNLI